MFLHAVGDLASKSFQCPRSPAASSSSARAFRRRYDPLPQATRSDVRERAHNHSVKMYPRGREAPGALTCEEWTALGFQTGGKRCGLPDSASVAHTHTTLSLAFGMAPPGLRAVDNFVACPAGRHSRGFHSAARPGTHRSRPRRQAPMPSHSPRKIRTNHQALAQNLITMLQPPFSSRHSRRNRVSVCHRAGEMILSDLVATLRLANTCCISHHLHRQCAHQSD